MIDRRWKWLTAGFALAAIGVSAWVACVCFSAFGGITGAVRLTLLYRLVLCAFLHSLSFGSLVFAFCAYMSCRHGTGFDLCCVSCYLLLMVSAQYLYVLRDAQGGLGLTLEVVRLYCRVLAPLALLGVVRCHTPKSRYQLSLAMIPIAFSALLPLVFIGSFEQNGWICQQLALISQLAVVVFSVFRLIKTLKPRTAFHLLGFTVGLCVLAITMVVGGISGLASGYDDGSVRFGLYALALGVAVDAMRPTLGIERKLQNYDELRKREEEYRFSSRHMSMYVIRYQVSSHTTLFRPDAALAFGLPQMIEDMPDTLISMGRVAENSIPAIRDMYERIDQGERTGSAIFGIYKKNGALVWLHTDFTTNFDDEGNPENSIISSYEIVGMREKEAAYKSLRREYFALSKSGLCICYEIDLTAGEVRDSVGELFERPDSDIFSDMAALTRHILDSHIEESDREALLRLLDRERLLNSYAQDVRRETLDCHRLQNGESLWTQASVRMISDPYSSDVLAFVMFEDIEEQKRREARERVRSQTDELTGLLTRVSFVEQFSDLCLATGVEGCHAVLMIDLDGFKAVNDTFGHRFGDKVLADVAGDLRAINRSDDLIARLGGDEYILCLKNIPTDTDFLSMRCREICHALSKQYGDDVAISGSVGVAIYPDDGQTFDELYQHADQAQYYAKQLGRNRYVFYNSKLAAIGSERVAPDYGDAGEEPAPEAREHRHTVLVVDDQRINRLMLSSIFQNDYDVLEAADGNEALAVLSGSQRTISAMVLDLMMPGLDGLGVLREMNKDAYYQSIPVIVVSAADEDEYSLRAIELGAVDYVTKPIDERLVLLRVRNAILRRDSENLRAQNRDLLVQRADETRHQNQLRYLADHDTLTHICNKNAFYRKSHDMIKRRTDKRFCIVSFDVQRFRAVNDIFGHDEGDRLLRYIAMQMRNLIGQDGTFTRADTDNFAFCVVYDRERVESYIGGLLSAMSHYDLSFEVQLSFGIYVIEDTDLPVNQMYDRSEMAKRTVKGSYVKRWAYYDDNMRAALLEEQEIVSHMNAALEGGEFLVYYQPKCALDTGMVVGAEALARWNHKTRGLLNPGVFIPIFEKNGFIMRLDIYMWERVCAYLSERLKKDPSDHLHVSVNISRANLYNPNLGRTLDGICRKYGVPNSRVEVEITESAYVENAHLLLGLTDELHRLGFTVEMDDFGSGYSSLNMLKEIPVDVLKLDMRFLYGVHSNDRGGSILRSAVSMARELHLQVIAEGVETEEQARFLAGIGCKQAQGFYYAKPMPQKDFAAMYDGQMDMVSAQRGGLEDAKAEIGRLLCSAAVLERSESGVLLRHINEYYMHMMRIDNSILDRVDMQLSNWTGAQDAKTLDTALAQAKESGQKRECVYLQRDLSDRYHLLRATVSYLCDEGDAACYLATFVDISGERDA